MGAIRAYLASLPYHAYNDGNCEPGTYYMVNNQEAGFAATGEPLGRNGGRLPPQAQTDHRRGAVGQGHKLEMDSGGRDGDRVTAEYCGICDPLIYSSAVMTTPLRSSLQDHQALFRDLSDAAAMPAVAFVIPPNTESGHPASSNVSRYEEFVRRVVEKVQANRT